MYVSLGGVGCLAGAGSVAPPANIRHQNGCLLFHGCVQAEPGHLLWVTGLLAVFAVSSNLRAVPDIHTRLSASSRLLWKYAFYETQFGHFFKKWMFLKRDAVR